MALRSTLMEETHKYRREGLRHLLEKLFGNNQAALAKATNISPGLLHDSLNAHRNVGERIARRVEEKLKLAPGALDKPLEWQERNGDRRGSQKKTKLGKLKQQRVAA